MTTWNCAEDIANVRNVEDAKAMLTDTSPLERNVQHWNATLVPGTLPQLVLTGKATMMVQSMLQENGIITDNGVTLGPMEIFRTCDTVPETMLESNEVGEDGIYNKSPNRPQLLHFFSEQTVGSLVSNWEQRIILAQGNEVRDLCTKTLRPQKKLSVVAADPSLCEEMGISFNEIRFTTSGKYDPIFVYNPVTEQGQLVMFMCSLGSNLNSKVAFNQGADVIIPATSTANFVRDLKGLELIPTKKCMWSSLRNVGVSSHV